MRRLYCALVAVPLCLLPCLAGGAPIYDTLGVGDTFGGSCITVTGSGTGLRQEVGFSFTVSGGAVSLDSVDIALSRQSSSGSVRLSIVEDAGGIPGSTVVDSVVIGDPITPFTCGDTSAPQCDGRCGPGLACTEVSGACQCEPAAAACGSGTGAPQCYGECTSSQACVDDGGTCMCADIGKVESATFAGGAILADEGAYWLVVETEPVSSSTRIIVNCADPQVDGRAYRENGGAWTYYAADPVAAFRVEGTPLPPIDSYKCYKVKDLKQPAFVPVSGIQLVDQFVDQDVAATKLASVCTPVDKDGAGIQDATTHQCCYKLKAAALDTTPSALLEGGLQSSTVEVKKPSTLCVPCTKTVLP